MTNRLAIVACSKQKLGQRARAAELYLPSRLFSLSLQQAEADGYPVLILSSKYGLVAPDDSLDPYEVDLTALSESAKHEWEALVDRQLETLLSGDRPHDIVLFAGAAYREPIQRLLYARGVSSRTHPSWRSICDEAFR